MVAGVALVLQFVTSGRFEFLSGRIGIDVTMAFHKWSAKVLVVMVIIHPLTFIVPNVLADPSRSLDWLIYLFFDRRFLTGTVSGVATILLVVMALYREKLGRYGVWRASHGLLALAAVVFLVLHVLRAGHYARFFPLDALWPLLAIVVLASALTVYGDRALQMVMTRWRVAGNRKVADGLWEVTLSHAGGQGLSLSRRTVRLDRLRRPALPAVRPSLLDRLGAVGRQRPFLHHQGVGRFHRRHRDDSRRHEGRHRRAAWQLRSRRRRPPTRCCWSPAASASRRSSASCASLPRAATGGRCG